MYKMRHARIVSARGRDLSEVWFRCDVTAVCLQYFGHRRPQRPGRITGTAASHRNNDSALGA